MTFSATTIPLNVFHELEVGAPLLDLLDRARSDLVYQVTEDGAILQDVLIPWKEGNNQVVNIFMHICSRLTVLLGAWSPEQPQSTQGPRPLASRRVSGKQR